MYTTPRTLPPGKVQHILSADTWGVNLPRGARSSSDPVLLPTVPAYTARVGLSEHTELGVHVTHGGTMPGVDLKLQLVRGRVDLALIPRIEGTIAPTGSNQKDFPGLLYLSGPLLLGVNVSEWVTIVAGGGLLYGSGGFRFNSNSSDQRAHFFAPTGGMASLTVGVDVRSGKGFALHPEISVMRHLSEEALFTMAGLGFAFGAAAPFDDVR
jgi:hypothetical protein